MGIPNLCFGRESKGKLHGKNTSGIAVLNRRDLRRNARAGLTQFTAPWPQLKSRTTISLASKNNNKTYVMNCTNNKKVESSHSWKIPRGRIAPRRSQLNASQPWIGRRHTLNTASMRKKVTCRRTQPNASQTQKECSMTSDLPFSSQNNALNKSHSSWKILSRKITNSRPQLNTFQSQTECRRTAGQCKPNLDFKNDLEDGKHFQWKIESRDIQMKERKQTPSPSHLMTSYESLDFHVIKREK